MAEHDNTPGSGQSLQPARYEQPLDELDVVVGEALVAQVPESNQAQVTPTPNWARTVTSYPTVIARPESEADVIALLRDTANYPAPVRPMGHYHSTTACAVTQQGTLVDMTRMKEVIEITDQFVRVQAGAQFLDVMHALKAQGLHFPVDLQIGNVTLGSLATCDTKDGAYPGGFGQFGAYVTHVRLVSPAGEVLDIDDTQPDLFRAVRSSYGLLGIVTEVTVQVEAIPSVSIEHKKYSFESFVAAYPQLCERNGSMMVYLFPFADRIIAQLRSPGDPHRRRNRWVWPLRNFGVAWVVSLFARLANLIRISTLRYFIQQTFNAAARFMLVHIVKAANTDPTQQTTDYPDDPRLACFTFSIFAFPLHRFPQVLMAYQTFCWNYYNATSYRPDLLTVGYHVTRSDYATFSYSAEGDVFTIDPVATGGEGWEAFVAAFNEFAITQGGKPLFNQSPGLQSEQVQKAYGGALAEFESVRHQLDPERRMMNAYFAELLMPAA
ncbi:MAG: FAD-binding protein [bacterium]